MKGRTVQQTVHGSFQRTTRGAKGITKRNNTSETFSNLERAPKEAHKDIASSRRKVGRVQSGE